MLDVYVCYFILEYVALSTCKWHMSMTLRFDELNSISFKFQYPLRLGIREAGTNIPRTVIFYEYFFCSHLVLVLLHLLSST